MTDKTDIKVHPDARALIFDLDGTLSDSMGVHIASWNKIGEKYGFDREPHYRICQENY